MGKFRGFIETCQECEADTEEEAKKKMAEDLAKRIQSGETGFILWEVTNGKS